MGRPPGPRYGFPRKYLPTMRRDPLGFLTRLARQYGDVACFEQMGLEMYALNHPDLAKSVLVTQADKFKKSRALQRARIVLGNGLLTSEGEYHLRQRRLALGAFHKQRVAVYAQVMADYAARARKRWKDGATLNVSAEMHRLTMAIVAKVLFDADVESESQEIREGLSVFLRIFPRMMLPRSDWLLKVPLPMHRKFHRSRERLDATIYRIIEDRRKRNVESDDLLSMLLEARDSEGDGGGMTDEQLRDEVMTLFLAGHETTANALTWTWMLLSENRDVEVKLHAELDRALGGRLPGANDIADLAYCEAVFAEAMRLYPPAWLIGREALEDVEIGGYTIPKGSVVFVSPFVMHRDARFFPEPQRFNPERWLEDGKRAKPGAWPAKTAFFPFGGGPRRCIGEAFAWMEGVLLIATIAQKWRMQLVPGQRIELQPIITLRPRRGIRMTLEARSGRG